MSSSASYSESPDAKKPCKGILKSSSFDKQFGSSGSSNNRKSAKFDELNVLQTYHPPNKDYGHMKVDEPNTPYNYIDHDLAEADELDAELLTEKLKVAQETGRRASIHAEESSEEEDETEDDKVKRIEFEKRRKLHYNEASAMKLARKLIEEEIEDENGAVSEEASVKGDEELEDVPLRGESSAGADNPIEADP